MQLVHSARSSSSAGRVHLAFRLPCRTTGACISVSSRAARDALVRGEPTTNYMTRLAWKTDAAASSTRGEFC